MIALTNISKQYGRQILFVETAFQLNPGEKVGLVGPNGAGKTTLFRMITGEEQPDEGDVSVPKKLTVGYFRQDIEEMSGRSVLDEAIAAAPPASPATSKRGARPAAARDADSRPEPAAAQVRQLLGDAEFADAHARFQHQAGMSPASPVSGSEGGSERAPEPPVDGPAPAVQISRR